MRIRGLVLLAAIAVTIAVALPAPADSDVTCIGTRAVAIAVGSVRTPPACSLPAFCPVTASTCDVSIRGTAGGVGLVGILISVNGNPFTSCGGLLSCDTMTTTTVNALGGGEQWNVKGVWSGSTPVTSGGVAVAALAEVTLEVAVVENA